MKHIVIGGSNSHQLAKAIATTLHALYSELRTAHFPDDNLYVRFMTEIKNANVILVNSMHPNPSESLIEIVFACNTARKLGAKKITLVVPYLAFMRQDKAFHPGECIAAREMANLLSHACDRLVTIDPHLHRIHNLNEIFTIPTTCLTSNSLIATHISQHFKNAVIIGPDGESNQWTEAIAQQLQTEVIVLKKKRYSANTVRIRLSSSIALTGKTVILVDDIISTGHTLLETVRQVKRHKPKKIVCIGVHGIFAHDALKKLKEAGAEVITTNTIANQVAKIDVAGLVAGNLQ